MSAHFAMRITEGNHDRPAQPAAETRAHGALRPLATTVAWLKSAARKQSLRPCRPGRDTRPGGGINSEHRAG